MDKPEDIIPGRKNPVYDEYGQLVGWQRDYNMVYSISDISPPKKEFEVNFYIDSDTDDEDEAK